MPFRSRRSRAAFRRPTPTGGRTRRTAPGTPRFARGGDRAAPGPLPAGVAGLNAERVTAAGSRFCHFGEAAGSRDPPFGSVSPVRFGLSRRPGSARCRARRPPRRPRSAAARRPPAHWQAPRRPTKCRAPALGSRTGLRPTPAQFPPAPMNAPDVEIGLFAPRAFPGCA